MQKLACIAAAAFAMLLAGVPAASGGTATCESTFEEPFSGEADNLVVKSGKLCVLEGAHVNGNVYAEPGSELQIGPGTQIKGNVDAGSGALTASFEATIGGSYKCNACNFEDVVFTSVAGNVQINGVEEGDFIVGSTIGGSLEIQKGTVGNFAFAILGNQIAGNVKLDQNTGALGVEDNAIGGNLQISGNTIAPSLCAPDTCPPFGNGHVDRNTVKGNLLVTKNTGEPLSISDNAVHGNLQCKGNSPAPAGAGNSAAAKEGQCRNL